MGATSRAEMPCTIIYAQVMGLHRALAIGRDNPVYPRVPPRATTAPPKGYLLSLFPMKYTAQESLRIRPQLVKMTFYAQNQHSASQQAGNCRLQVYP